MASGKTAVGQRLAKRLKKKYVSTDSLIERALKMKIHTIFKLKGEKFFRKKETQILRTLLNRNNMVLATGGGIVIKPQNRKMLKKIGVVVWLKASPKIIDKRLGNLKNRPLLNIKDAKQRLNKISSMLKERKKFYSESADISINTDKLDIKTIVDKIITVL